MEREARGREAQDQTDQLGGWVVCVDEGEVHAACRSIRHNPRYLSCLVLTPAASSAGVQPTKTAILSSKRPLQT